MIGWRWKEILIVVLIGLLALTGNAYLSERDAHTQTRTEFKVAQDAADAARREMEFRSDEALKKLKDEHTINLKRAKDNAYRNFLARYGAAAECMLHPAAPRPDHADPAGGAETPDGASANNMAVEGFVRDCAATTVMVVEFQEWAKLNRLPVEQGK